MKNTFRISVVLLALPLVATAAVGASQWVYENTPIQLNVDVASALAAKPIQTRGHKVALNATGGVEGRLMVLSDSGLDLEGLQVHLLQGGQIAASATASSDGTFAFSNVTEGAYSLISSGDSAFAAYGVHVVGESTEGASDVMELALVAPADKARGLINAKEVAQAETADADLATIPKGANRVLLDQGVLTGTVHTLLPTSQSMQSTVHLLDGTTPIATVETDANGKFEIKDVRPGVYSFVAVGSAGFAALSFEAVGPEVKVGQAEPANLPNIGVVGPAPQEVIYQEYAQDDDLDVVLAGDSVDVLNSVQYSEPVYITEFAPIEYVTESVGYGGAYGGSVGSTGSVGPLLSGSGRLGGIGGGPGLGRLGRLAILGGTVVGIVAIADGGSSPAAATNPDPN